MLSVKFPTNDKARYSTRPHSYHYQKEPFTSSNQLIEVLNTYNTFFAVTHAPYASNTTTPAANTLSELTYSSTSQLLSSQGQLFSHYQQGTHSSPHSLSQELIRSEYSHTIIIDLDYKPQLYKTPARFTKQEVIDSLLTFASYVVYAPSSSSEGDTPNGRYFVPLTKPISKRQQESYLQWLFHKHLGARMHTCHYKNSTALYTHLMEGTPYRGVYLHECLDTSAFKPTQKLNTYEGKPLELYVEEGRVELDADISTVAWKDISRRTNHTALPRVDDLSDEVIEEYLDYMTTKTHGGKTHYEEAKEAEEGDISEMTLVELRGGITCTIREWTQTHREIRNGRRLGDTTPNYPLYRSGDASILIDFQGIRKRLYITRDPTTSVVTHELDTYVTPVHLDTLTVIEAPTGSGKTYQFGGDSAVLLLLPTNKQVASMATEGFVPVTSGIVDGYMTDPLTIKNRAIAMTFDKFAGHLLSEDFVEWVSERLIVVDEFPLLFTAQRSQYAYGRDRLLDFLRDTTYYSMRRVFLSANMDAYKILEELGFENLLVHKFVSKQQEITVVPLSPKHLIPQGLTESAFIFTNSLSKIGAYDNKEMTVVTSETDMEEVLTTMRDNPAKSVIFTSTIREGISFHNTEFKNIIVDASVNREDPTGANQALQAMARPRNSTAKRYIFAKPGESTTPKLRFKELLILVATLEAEPHLVEKIDFYKPILEELRKARVSGENTSGWQYSRVLLMGITLRMQALHESYVNGMLEALNTRNIPTKLINPSEIEGLSGAFQSAQVARKDWASYKDCDWLEMVKLVDNPDVPQVRKDRITYLLEHPSIGLQHSNYAEVYTLTEEVKTFIVNDTTSFVRVKNLHKPEIYENAQIEKLYKPTLVKSASLILNRVYKSLNLSSKISSQGTSKFLTKIGLDIQWLDKEGNNLMLVKGAKGKHLYYEDIEGSTYKLNKNKDPTGAYLKAANPFEWLANNSIIERITI